MLDLLFRPTIITLGAGLLVTYLIVPFLITGFTYLGLLDRPGLRRVHKEAVPRGGGLAVFIGFHIAAACIIYHYQSQGQPLVELEKWIYFVVASSFLCMVGFVDDLCSVRPIVKLCGQITAAVLMVIADVSVADTLGIQIPEILNFGITVLWFLVVVNSFNLIDGIDALATGTAIVASLGIAISMMVLGEHGFALLCFALIGACLGFLRYNYNPAKIFLGDTGSMFLGFCIGAIVLFSGSPDRQFSSVLIPILTLSVPLFDTVLAIWRRSLRRVVAYFRNQPRTAGWMSADMDHLHHRLLKKGYTHKRAALQLVVVTAIVSLSASLIALVPTPSRFIGGVLVLGIGGVFAYYAKREIWDTGMAIVYIFRRTMRPRITICLYLFLEIVGLSFCLLCAILVLESTHGVKEIFARWVTSAPLWCGVPWLLLIVTESSRLSNKNESDDSTLSLWMLVLGVTATITLSDRGETGVQLQIQAVMYLFFSALFLKGLARVPMVVERVMERRLRKAVGLAFGKIISTRDAWCPSEVSDPKITCAFEELVATVEGAILEQKHWMEQILLEHAEEFDLEVPSPPEEDTLRSVH